MDASSLSGRAEDGARKDAQGCWNRLWGRQSHFVCLHRLATCFGFSRDRSRLRLPAEACWSISALAILFVVPHSVLLLPVVRQRLTRLLPDAFYGSLFCVVTCASLLVVFANWQFSPSRGLAIHRARAFDCPGAFYGSWLALFYSLSLTGLGYQTGWTPWWHWVRGKPLPARKFEPRGAYLWLRHPVYLSFLGLDLVCAGDDCRPGRADGDMDRVHFLRQLAERSTADPFLGRSLPPISSGSAWLSRYLVWTTRSRPDEFPAWSCDADHSHGQTPIGGSQSRLSNDQ